MTLTVKTIARTILLTH